MSEAVTQAAITATLAVATGGTSVAFQQVFFNSLALYATTQAVNQVFANKPGGNNNGIQQKGRTVMFRQSDAPRQLVYGTARVSGPIVFAAVTGDQQQYLHLVIPVAGHRVQSLDQVYFNDRPVSEWDQFNTPHIVTVQCGDAAGGYQLEVAGTTHSAASIGALATLIDDEPDYIAADIGNGQIQITGATAGVSFAVVGVSNIFYVRVTQQAATAYRINKHLGDSSQSADADLVAEVPEWTANHRLRGCAYLYCRLAFNTDAYPNGVPNISVDITGKNDIYDPRDTLTKYSNNWALCVADYMRQSYGFGVQTSEIESAKWIASANNCDEGVTVGAGTQPRYTMNGVILMDGSRIETLEAMMVYGAGQAVWQHGQWHIISGQAVAQPYEPELNADDLRDDILFAPRAPRRELFNGVKGTFIDPLNHHQNTDFPPHKNPTYAAEDGEEIIQEIQLPLADDQTRCQRLGKILLEDSRQALHVVFPAKYKALQYSVGDVVPVTIDELGWAQKLFHVKKWGLADGGANLLLQEYASGVYDWNDGEATRYDLAPNTTMPSPSYVVPPSLLYAESGETHVVINAGVLLSRIYLRWQNNDAFAAQFEVEYKLSAFSAWTPAAPARALDQYIVGVIDGQSYDMRVRTVNTLVQRSSWVYLNGHTVIGKTSPPPSPTDLTITELPTSNRKLEVTISGELPVDFAGYEFRARAGIHSNYDDLSVANGGILLHTGLIKSVPWETNQIPAGEHTIGVVLVDTSGNVSANSRLETYTFEPALVTTSGLVANAVSEHHHDTVLPVNSDEWLIQKDINAGYETIVLASINLGALSAGDRVIYNSNGNILFESVSYSGSTLYTGSYLTMQLRDSTDTGHFDYQKSRTLYKQGGGKGAAQAPFPTSGNEDVFGANDSFEITGTETYRIELRLQATMGGSAPGATMTITYSTSTLDLSAVVDKR